MAQPKGREERFVPKNNVPRNGFPIVFSKSDLGGGAYFLHIFFFFLTEHPGIYTQVLLLMCTILDSVTALLSPSPPNPIVNGIYHL